MTTPRDPLGEEGKRIVAWLRETAIGHLRFDDGDAASPSAAAYNALHLAALRIERGDHLATTEEKP